MSGGQISLSTPRVALVRRGSLEAWSGQDESILPPDVLQHAYDEALRFHKVMFPHGKGESWLSEPSSIQDVLDVLAQIQRNYESKTASRWRSAATAVSWWMRASSKMIQYETVIDSIVSSNPEYAGLVWGAMKFLFKATLNHQEMSTKIAQAFAEIGDVLPEAEFRSRLFPRQEIRAHLAKVYAHIVEFCIRATQWYQKVRKSLWKKTLNAAFKTWPLEFQDICHEIERHIARIREMSVTGHQAETRHIHLRVQDLSQQVRDLMALLTPPSSHIFGPQTTPFQLNPSIIPSLPFVPERITRYLVRNAFDPNQALKLATAMRDRDRARGGSVFPGIWASKQLRDWISSPDSALLQLRGSVLRAGQPRDVASDLIELLQATSLPVVWYLSSTSSLGQVRVSMIDVFRSLIEQTIHQHEHAQDNQPWRLNEGHFENCKTEEDWQRLLVAVLSHLSKLVIVIDAHQDASGDIPAVINKFWDDMKAQNVATVVKVLVLTYGTAPGVVLGNFPILPATSTASRSPREFLGSSRRAGLSRTGSRFQTRRPKTLRVSPHSSGPEELKPFVLQLVAHETSQPQGVARMTVGDSMSGMVACP